METAQRLVYYSEDDPLMARMFERIFRFHGFAVVIASDGEEAIAKLTQLPASPSVIILDVMMPKRSGFEVLEFIKTQSLFKDVPVVMLSNLAGKEDADRAIQLGARSYLIKSQYQPKEIVEKVKEIIETDEQGRVGTKETS